MTGNNNIKVRSTAKQKRKLKQIVLDCNIRRYTNDKTLEYIQTTTGKNMTLRNLLYIKAEVKEEANLWLDSLAYTKHEYVATYKERIEELFECRRSLTDLLEEAKQRQDGFMILHVNKELRELTKDIARMHNAGPLVKALRDRIMNAIEHQEKKEEEEQEQVSNNCDSNNKNNVAYDINSDGEDNSSAEQNEDQEQGQEQPQQSGVDDWKLVTAKDTNNLE